MSGNITVTPGYTFTSNTDPLTLTKLNQLTTPTAVVNAGAITSRELGSSVLLVDPSSQAVFYEDFVVEVTTAGIIGTNDLTSIASGAGASVTMTATTGGRAGTVLFTDTTAASGYCFIRGAASVGSWIPGSGIMSWEWSVYAPSRVSDVTNNYSLYIGLANGAANGNRPTDGCYFSYNYATLSGNWVGETALSSSYTQKDSSIPMVVNTWYTLKATVNALGTSIEFFINGTSIGTSTTNLPTAALTPICGMNTTTGTATSITMLADWCKIIKTFTTPR